MVLSIIRSKEATPFTGDAFAGIFRSRNSARLRSKVPSGRRNMLYATLKLDISTHVCSGTAILHSLALTSLLPAMAKREPTAKLINMRNQRGRARDLSVEQRINRTPFLMSRVREVRNLTQSLFPADLLFASITPVWFLCSTSIARTPAERKSDREKRERGEASGG